MPEYRFYQTIEVRYGDLDAQGHVNNAKYLTYMEQARIAYIQQLGLWEGKSFHDVGIILAEIQVRFLAAIRYNQTIRVGARVTRLGEKRIEMEYSLTDTHTQKEMAHGQSVLVAYDYAAERSIPIPEVWRHAICTFEGIPSITARTDG